MFRKHGNLHSITPSLLLKVLFGLLGLVAINERVLAQAFSITDGSINTCAGILLDSGGQGGTGYQNNENYTVVICPDVPGDVISLNWVTFNLNTTGPQPLDRIRLFDGNNTGATFLGEYNGIDLQNLVTQATTFNVTGCMTVQFISNGSGTGIFAASISCETPCDRPTAEAIMSEGIPALICVGEELNFDGTASYAAPGFNIASYTWDFADGTTADTPIASHSWDEAGEYIVQLYLLDNNDCASSNLVDFQVFVSTTPSFNGTIESFETCLGATVDLTAVVTPTTWTGVPENNFGPPVYLPDNLGIPFTSEIAFTQFSPGQTLDDIGDLFSVCVDMEHSFMGDLVVSLTCPNGQNVIFHQQGGGGTDLGISGPGSTLGTCWEYCWSPTATNGTWVANSGGGSLPSGTYQSLQPMSQLEGCPLNGTWTITFVDLWAADDGWLCGWEMNVNPSIIPDVTEFTPVINPMNSDSVGWTGPGLVLDPGNPLLATAAPSVSGSYDYTFSATDNFGCSYDTTITVTVAMPLEVEAGPDIVLCNDPLPMAGEVTSAGPSSCEWTLGLFETFGDTWNGGASLAVTIDGVTTNYSISGSNIYEQFHTLSVNAGSTITLQYTAGSIFNGENSFDLTDDAGNVIFSSMQGPSSGIAWSGTATCGGSNIQVEYLWSPDDGLDDPTDPLTDVFVTQPTWFYLSAFPPGSPECAVVDSVLVSPDPSIDAGENTSLVVCANEPEFLLTDSLAGTPDDGGVWSLSGTTVPELFDPQIGAEGTYTYTITSANNCVATSELDITIIPVTDPTCCGIADAGEYSYSCDLSINLYATPGNTGVGVWTGPAGAVYDDANSPETMVTMPLGGGGTHMFYWIEDDGAFCYLIDSVEKTLTDPIIIDFTTTDAICYSYCDGTADAIVTGGNIAADFIYDWSSGTGSTTPAVTDLCAGEFTLAVADDNGCEQTESFTIGQPILLEIDSLSTQPVTCSGFCDGQVEIYDMEAVEYSFNDGASWSTEPILENSCEGLYPIQIRDAIGCIGTGVITVTGPPPVFADFEWGPQNANVNAPLVNFLNTSENANTYDWDIAGMLQTNETNTQFLFDHRDPDVYEVCMIAYNMNMCSDTVCKFVDIEDVLFTYIPNAFSPDGDDVNDVFLMSTNIDVITDFNIVIFDRWGQIVFESVDPYEAWLGSHRNSGDILKTDVYAYRVTFEIKETQARREILGHVTLIK